MPFDLIGTLVCVFQYGPEEFGQDSPRYASPKPNANLYGDAYFLGMFLFFFPILNIFLYWVVLTSWLFAS